MTTIYCGNLSYDTTDDDLRTLFEPHGQVGDVRIIMDRYTERSKGFGFVDMPNENEATEAIAKLEGTDYQGRTLRVNEARPRTERPPRSGGGGGGGGGGYGGGGGGGRY